MDFSVNQNLLQKVDGIRKMLAWSLLPARCLLCNEPGMGDIDLCQACWEALPFNRQACSRCALPMSAPAAACAQCLKKTPAFFSTLAPMQYRASVSSLVPRFKFHQDLAAGRLLAEIFCRNSANFDIPDVLIPVPLHTARLRQRGFDQAFELTKMMAKSKSIPMRTNLLYRQRHTRAQSDLDAMQRRKNCRGAFIASRKTMPSHIALIDDVMTTGTTVNECAKVLLGAGARRVDVWVLARVATPGALA